MISHSFLIIHVKFYSSSMFSFEDISKNVVKFAIYGKP